MAIHRVCFMSSLGKSKLFLGLKLIFQLYWNTWHIKFQLSESHSLVWETDINNNAIIMAVLHKTSNLK